MYPLKQYVAIATHDAQRIVRKQNHIFKYANRRDHHPKSRFRTLWFDFGTEGTKLLVVCEKTANN